MISIRAARTLARFLRHSVHAFGVTMPNPRRRFEFCELWAADEADEGPAIGRDEEEEDTG